MTERGESLAKASLEIPDHVLFRDLDGEGVLLNLETGEYFGLNRVGTEIWRSLQTMREVGSIHAKLLNDYEVAPQTVWRDLEELISEMSAKGLVRVRATAGG